MKVIYRFLQYLHCLLFGHDMHHNLESGGVVLETVEHEFCDVCGKENVDFERPHENPYRWVN